MDKVRLQAAFCDYVLSYFSFQAYILPVLSKSVDNRKKQHKTDLVNASTQSIATSALQLGATAARVCGDRVHASFELRDANNREHGYADVIVSPRGLSIGEFRQRPSALGLAWSRELAQKIEALAKIQRL